MKVGDRVLCEHRDPNDAEGWEISEGTVSRVSPRGMVDVAVDSDSEWTGGWVFAMDSERLPRILDVLPRSATESAGGRDA